MLLDNQMQAIKDLNGNILGYTLPPEFEKLNKLTEIKSLSEERIGFILPPEFKKVKGLIELSCFSNESLGFLLPPDSSKLQKVLKQFIKMFKSSDVENLNKSISRIKYLINIIEEKKGIDTQKISQNLSNISNDLDNSKSLSLEQILRIITLLYTIFFGLIPSYPAMKDIYKDLTYDPIAEICGVITELEKEAVKFIEVNNRGGTQLYKYPKGKKSEYYLPESTQICMLNQPKGNEKRVKVIFKAENNKQIIGYVDRSKIKRLYNIN